MDGSKPGPGSPCGETQKGDSPASPQGLPGAGGTDPFLRWARRSASLFQQAGGSRHPWMWSRTSSTTASPCPLHPPALRQVPCQNFHLPHHPPPHLPAPPPRRCYGAGQNEGTMGQQKEEVHQPSGPLRTKRVAQAPHHQHQWVCACPSWWGVSSPTLLVAPTQRGKAVLGCLSRFLWGRSFFGDPLWLSEAALSFTSIFPCCSHFCCSPSPFYRSLRRWKSNSRMKPPAL